MARALETELRKRNIREFTASVTARDLGLDFAGGDKRATAVAGRRQVKGKRRLRASKCFVHAKREVFKVAVASGVTART